MYICIKITKCKRKQSLFVQRYSRYRANIFAITIAALLEQQLRISYFLSLHDILFELEFEFQQRYFHYPITYKQRFKQSMKIFFSLYPSLHSNLVATLVGVH